MIRLSHANFQQTIEWNENRHVGELVIESPTFFRNVARDLNEERDDTAGLCLTKEANVLKYGTDVDVVFNPMKLEFNNRRAVTTLFKMLVKTSNSEDFYLKTNEFKTRILKYLDEVVEAEGFNFDVVADDFTLNNIAKAVNFHVDSDEDDYVEFLTDYMEVMVELAETKLFVFVNLRSYLTDEEFSRLVENILNHQFDVLLIENQDYGKCEGVQRIIVDKDGCEI